MLFATITARVASASTQTAKPVVEWSLDDPFDQRLAALGHVELAQMHRLAGARAIVTAHWGGPVWREGDDFDASSLRSVATGRMYERSPPIRWGPAAWEPIRCRLSPTAAENSMTLQASGSATPQPSRPLPA